MLLSNNLTPLFLSDNKNNKEQGNRRYQNTHALCTPNTPFPADRPHRLRSEFTGFLFALALHIE